MERNSKGVARWEICNAFTARVDDEAFENGRAEEPVDEEDPDEGECEEFEESVPCAYAGWAGKKSKGECGGCPGPCVFDKIYVERVRLGGKVM